MTSKVRILLADDHAVLRSGLRLLINAQPDLEVVAEAADGRETLAQAREARPDVTVLDLTMPRTDGIKTIAQLVRERAANRVLVLTMHDDPAYADAALAAGAAGYVLKKAADRELLSAIRAVASGLISVDSTVRAPLAGGGSYRRGGRAASTAGRARLSRREAQVLRLLGQGYTHREIAGRLQIGEKSVETYRARLAEKLQLRRRAELVRYALQMGFLSPDNLASEDEPPRGR